VRVLQPEGGAAHQFARVVGAERPDRVTQPRERDALDQFHNQKVNAVGRAGVGRADDVRVVEPPDHFHFELEPLDRVRVAGGVREQHLHRDGLLEVEVLGPVHGAHAAAPEARAEAVRAELNRRRGVRRARAGRAARRVAHAAHEFVARAARGHVRADQVHFGGGQFAEDERRKPRAGRARGRAGGWVHGSTPSNMSLAF